MPSNRSLHFSLELLNHHSWPFEIPTPKNIKQELHSQNSIKRDNNKTSAWFDFHLSRPRYRRWLTEVYYSIILMIAAEMQLAGGWLLKNFETLSLNVSILFNAFCRIMLYMCFLGTYTFIWMHTNKKKRLFTQEIIVLSSRPYYTPLYTNIYQNMNYSNKNGCTKKKLYENIILWPTKAEEIDGSKDCSYDESTKRNE